LPVTSIGGKNCGWGEAWRLINLLANDTSARLCADLNGWPHPISVEAIVLADLYDAFAATHTAKGKTPVRHPVRPWLRAPVKKTHRSALPADRRRTLLAKAKQGEI